MYQPMKIRYPEDELRKQFFSDHPWELARPRVVLERDGEEGKDVDWSKGVQQPGRPTTGEDVVQRQLYLLQTVPRITVAEAYDKARKEFYDVRRQEDIRGPDHRVHDGDRSNARALAAAERHRQLRQDRPAAAGSH